VTLMAIGGLLKGAPMPLPACEHQGVTRKFVQPEQLFEGSFDQGGPRK
jgi:hypothetical protein